MADYNPAEEARLLQYNNTSNEVLVDVIRYAFDGDGDKYIEMGYSIYLNLEPVIRIRDGCGDFGSGGCQALLNKNSALLTAEEWKTLMINNTPPLPLKIRRKNGFPGREFGDTYRPIIELLTGIVTKMEDHGISASIQSRKIKENKNARGSHQKKKMATRSHNSDCESSESGNISRDIRMPRLPATPNRSYPSLGLKRWLSA
ncbi:hypothetical protein FQA39_LY14099 [Lamprigera yunnana]|nr:hypothetical protein FQA39_LY14099 [Lamprigera yunnana]